MGYTGAADGLLDPETNLTYAVAYLANAFRVAGGDAQRAIRLYANGYYYEAKRQGLLGEMRTANHSNQIQTASDEQLPPSKSAAAGRPLPWVGNRMGAAPPAPCDRAPYPNVTTRRPTF